MGAGVEFGKSDVKEMTDKDPWQRRQDFSDEVSTEDMADTAVQYAVAAGKAGSAGELARLASEQSADSGSLNGAELLEKEQRDALTANDLGNNGAQMDAVVGNILKGMGFALDAEDENEQVIDGGGDYGTGLDQRIEDLSDDAKNDYDNCARALENTASGGTLPAGHPLAPDPSIAPKVVYDNVEYEAARGQGGWVPPYELVAAIRKIYLDQAVEAAEEADGDIKDVIEKYRRDMGELALELEDAGYDTSEGPLRLWHTEEMATYNAIKLEEELQKENPRSSTLERYSSGLGSAVDDMFDADGNVREDFDANTSQLDEYTQEFLQHLTADSLATLGAMNPPRPPVGEEYTYEDPLFAVQEAVANGINASMNEAVGGSDPGTGAPMPPGVKEFVYGYDQKLDEMGTRPDSGLRGAAQEYGNFGNLMSHATVASGDAFSRDMVNSALDVQRVIEEKNGDITQHNGSNSVAEMRSDPYPWLEVDGVDGLLTAASRNEEASADMLSDMDLTHDVLVREWQGSEGVADLIRAGTTLPQGVDHNSEAAEPYFAAAGNVLESTGANYEHLRSVNEGPRADTSAMHGAIGETAVKYMDLLAYNPTSGSSGPVPGVEVFGETYDHGFKLSESHHDGLFELMVTTDEDVAQQFGRDLGEWQYNTAYRAFSDAGDGGGPVHDMNNAVMRVSGYVDGAYEAVEGDGLRRSDLRTSMLAGANTLAGFFPQPVGFGVAVGVEAVRNLTDVPQEPADELNYHNDLRGDIYPRQIIARAARDAGYDGMGDADVPTLEEDDRPTTDDEATDGDRARERDAVTDAADGELTDLEEEHGYLADHDAYQEGRRGVGE
ncbi:hypothetical protein [Streptomyces smyrnaeus]|uniref:hypothetical protein n=1 Tax=Streptomyces smyrnaeus TaxID=1387713 RepID=UPI00340628AE